MSSLIQTNEQTLDYTSIHPKFQKQPTKTFTFFIYYQPSQRQSHHLQKLAFTLKEEKGSYGHEKHQHNCREGKQIQLAFVDVENQNDVEQSFLDLKILYPQNPKIKLVFYSTEYHMVSTIAKAKEFNIDLSAIPCALYSPDLHQDLGLHLGWRQTLLGDLALKSSVEFEENVRKWISSPGQRIDMWTAQIQVDSQFGQIHRLEPSSNTFLPIYEKTINQHFISHICLGHHAQLAANYESNRKQYNHSLLNRIIYNFQSFKKFCCIGNPSMQNSTGVVDIMFKDQKGDLQEISKYLTKAKEGECSKKQKKIGVLSLLLSNIDKFMGIKLNGGRLNDAKLQLCLCQSKQEFRYLGSASGEIVVKMRAEEIFMTVGSTCLKLVQPREIRIGLWGKVKVLISKDTLEC